MTAVLTTAGTTHLAELAAGGSLTNFFDTLVFGLGNGAPTNADTLAAVNDVDGDGTATDGLGIALSVTSGYPKLDDTDPRNTGRGALVWTWRFERGAGTPFVASNAAVTNPGQALTDALLAHARQVIAQRYDERLIVWVNCRTGETPTFVVATEQALENRVQRVESFTARTRAVAGNPGGSVVDTSSVRSVTDRGVGVDTLAHVIGTNGSPLTVAQVDVFRLYVAKFNPSDGEFEGERRDTMDCAETVLETEQYGDPRWHAQGGYNVAHKWMQPRGTSEGTYRLRYEMRLCDGDMRAWTNVVEVR